MFALMGPAMIMMTTLDRAGRNRRVRRKSRRGYRKELVDFRADLVETVEYERRRRRAMHPDLPEVVRRAVVASASLWDRRRGTPSSSCCPWGSATSPGSPLGEDSSDPDDQPELAGAIDEAAILRLSPLTVPVTPGTVIGLAGDRAGALAGTRGMLLQVGVHHGPAEVRIVLVASQWAASDWEWLKWLPHVRPSSFSEGRLLVVIADDNGYVDGAVIDEVVADAESGASLLVIIDTAWLSDAGDLAVRRLLRRDAASASGIVIAPGVDGLPDQCDIVVEHHETAGEATCRWPREGGRSVEFVVAGVEEALAERAARAVARFSDPDAGGGSAALPAPIGQAEILDLQGASPAEIADAWATAGPIAPALGLAESGPIAVNLESSGPHLAVVGGRGSGKTEHLLAMTFSGRRWPMLPGRSPPGPDTRQPAASRGGRRRARRRAGPASRHHSSSLISSRPSSTIQFSARPPCCFLGRRTSSEGRRFGGVGPGARTHRRNDPPADDVVD